MTDIAGYVIYYGTGYFTLTNQIPVNLGLQTYVVSGLGPGKWYFAVVAVNASGIESRFSQIMSKTI